MPRKLQPRGIFISVATPAHFTPDSRTHTALGNQSPWGARHDRIFVEWQRIGYLLALMLPICRSPGGVGGHWPDSWPRLPRWSFHTGVLEGMMEDDCDNRPLGIGGWSRYQEGGRYRCCMRSRLAAQWNGMRPCCYQQLSDSMQVMLPRHVAELVQYRQSRGVFCTSLQIEGPFLRRAGWSVALGSNDGAGQGSLIQEAIPYQSCTFLDVPQKKPIEAANAAREGLMIRVG